MHNESDAKTHRTPKALRAKSTETPLEFRVSFGECPRVPASRPTLPIRNSTGPEKVTEFPSLRVHFASEDVAGPHTFNFGSSSRKVPFPSPCASNRSARCSSFANVISAFHLPMRFGDCASAMTEQHVFTINVRINACAAFTFFSNPNLVSGQERRNF